MLSKMIKQSSKCNQKLRLIFLSLSISGIVKAASNTFYKCEYEHKIRVLYKTQTGFCK